jgi:hypothetical protein
MKRRQVIQAVPALVATTLLPSITWAKEPELEAPPTLVLIPIENDIEPGVQSLKGFWQPYGEDVYVSTHLKVRYRPLWWPEGIPHYGPASDAQFIAEYTEQLSRNYSESRLMFERTGMGWVQTLTTHHTPIRRWSRVQGEWRLGGGDRADDRGIRLDYNYRMHDRETLDQARQAWLASGKTEAEAYPEWCTREVSR